MISTQTRKKPDIDLTLDLIIIIGGIIVFVILYIGSIPMEIGIIMLLPSGLFMLWGLFLLIKDSARLYKRKNKNV